MKLQKIIKTGFKNLLVNKMRTGLAILGIVIGISSVIALVSLGEASKKSVQSRIQSIGSNLITVQPGSSNNGGIRGVAGGVSTLTLDDAKAIMTSPQVNTIKNVSPEYQGRSQIVAGSNNTNTQVLGVLPSYLEVRKTTLQQGGFITNENVNALSKVAVLGPTVASDLFGNSNPIGQTIRIGAQTFSVIGITKSKGTSGFNNQDDVVYIPLTTAQKLIFGTNYLSSLALEAKSDQLMNRAQNQVGYLLLSRHKLSDPSVADFRIMSQSDILETATQVTNTFTSLLTGVAAISLLVGGIGIMNIMLMSVTERTREIGLRKALGAKKKTIVTQFLIESVILTFVGGVIGIMVGIAGYFVYAKLTSGTFGVSVQSVLLAFGVSAIIGVVFGWYPAKKAADLQPIEALRYE